MLNFLPLVHTYVGFQKTFLSYRIKRNAGKTLSETEHYAHAENADTICSALDRELCHHSIEVPD